MVPLYNDPVALRTRRIPIGRGRHAQDPELFGERWHPTLRTAVAEYSWLLSRGYAEVAALALVGNRHALRKRQRTAVRRSACSDEARDRRRGRGLQPAQLSGRELAVDGFNVLITSECALMGGLLLRGRDGALRDLASIHGSYRRVARTTEALERLGRILAGAAPTRVIWYLDQPVSNSGRLAGRLRELATAHRWPWQVELVPSPDRLLIAYPDVVATSDAAILDRCQHWVDLPAVVAAGERDAWCLDLAARPGTA